MDVEKKRPKEEAEERSADSEMSEIMPPDGGWGWVVVFSSFMIHVIADGVTYTFGIFYVEFLKHFGQGKGMTAWVASIMVGVTFCIGPFASGLTNKYGCRIVTIVGALLASTGLLISLTAPNVPFLFLSIGLCTGAGFGLMYLPAIVSVTCYFEKKRAFATGIAVCGSGLGTFIMAPLTEWLVETYGWKGAMLIISGLVLNCAVFGGLFRPVQRSKPLPNIVLRDSDIWESQRLFDSEKEKEKQYITPPLRLCTSQSDINLRPSTCPLVRPKSDTFTTLSVPRMESRPSKNDILGTYLCEDGSVDGASDTSELPAVPEKKERTPMRLMQKEDVFYTGSLVNLSEKQRSNLDLGSKLMIPVQEAGNRKSGFQFCPREVFEALHEMLDFSLLKNPVFLLFGFSNFLTNIGFNVPYVYTKDRVTEMGIADEENASYVLAVIGIFNTIGRVILGYLSDKPWVNRLWLYNTSLTISGIATAFSCFSKNYALMLVYAATFGTTAGAYVSLTSVILVDLLGLNKLTNGFGLLLVFEGVACLLGPPITGWLYDGTGSYDPGFYVSGTMIALSGLMLFATPYVEKIHRRSLPPPNCNV